MSNLHDLDPYTNKSAVDALTDIVAVKVGEKSKQEQISYNVLSAAAGERSGIKYTGGLSTE